MAGKALRDYTRAETLADAAVHAVGVGFALVGAPVLIVLAALRADGAALASVSVYGASLIATFAASACYHLIRVPGWREALRRIDHGAIYLKIAGTYTPFAVGPLGDGPGRALLLGVWTVAMIGFAVKMAAPRRFEIASVALYLALGWAVVFVAGDVYESLSTAALTLAVTGGALYTIGVAFHLWNALPYQNAIWHLHVLVASICFYAAIALEVL